MAVERPRVLVVDDDAALRGLLLDALADEAYEARAVASGHEALALLLLWRPDLIVLDLRLQDMDGETFLTTLRGSGYSETPVVVLTAKAMTELEATMLQAPLLPKPFELDGLLGLVSRLVNRAQAAPPYAVAGEA
jgi:DNA-binding response OmpR family regulator